MGRTGKIIVLLVAGVVLLAAGLKGVLWYYTDSKAKEIKNSLPGIFDYSGVSTSLFGRTSIDGITLTVPTVSDPIKIEKVELVAGNIVELFSLAYKNKDKKFPEQLKLRIQGVSFKASTLRPLFEASPQPVDIACGSVKTIGVTELVEMGYQEIVADFDISYLYNPKINNLRVTWGVDFRDAVEAEMSFAGNTSVVGAAASSGRSGGLRGQNIPEFELHIKDNQYKRKLIKYCAKLEGKNLDEYVESMDAMSAGQKPIFDLVTAQAFGFVVSQEVFDALNEYNKDPKEIYFSLDPQGYVDLKELSLMSEEGALDIMRPVLRVNGEEVPIFFKWTDANGLWKQMNPPKKAVPIKGSHERILTPIHKLNATAFNKNIELQASSGVTYVGAFRKVEGDDVYMVVHEKTGTSEVSFNKRIIRRIYVLSDY